MSAPSALSSAGLSAPSPLVRWLFSSIGKKLVVALTGIGLVLFVISHLLGNLTIFAGPEAMNSYAMHLRDLGPLLWVARIGLIGTVVLHIYFTMLLWQENAAARPQKYAVKANIKTTVFARTMRLSGIFLLAFVIFHLGHFTLMFVNPEYKTYHAMVDGHEVHDVYRMVVTGFSHPVISLIYVIAMGLLAFHLSHGIGSLFQTLGFSNQRMRVIYERVARVVAWALFAGFSSIPIAVVVFGLGKNYVK